MKKHTPIPVLTLVSLVITTACTTEKDPEPKGETTVQATMKTTQDPGTDAGDGHTSQRSPDWNGTYQGIIPCADCEGIKIRVTLLENGQFNRTVTYLGKEETGRTDSGTLRWNETGLIVTLNPEGRDSQMYEVGERQLFHLDRAGNRITGALAENYELTKNRADDRLEDKTWLLTELMGQDVAAGEGNKEAFLVFNSETGRISGNNSCNLLVGSYELDEGSRIAIGQMAATAMACPDMRIADQFNEVLGKVDNYAIVDGILSLNRARMAPLARLRLQE